MDKRFLSIIVVVVVIGALLMFQASQSGTSRVLLPSELLAEVAGSDKAQVLSRLRVAGRVTADTIEYQDTAPFKLAFSIEDPEGSSGALPVIYNDLKPDMFATGRDVIIDGEYRDGTLHAAKLLTQCPSKYEPPKSYSEESQEPQTAQ